MLLFQLLLGLKKGENRRREATIEVAKTKKTEMATSKLFMAFTCQNEGRQLFLMMYTEQPTEADEHREPREFNLAQKLIFQTFYCRNK